MNLRLCSLALATALLASGCMTDEQIIGALTDVNHDFRLEYERILLEKGTRVYRVPRGAAYSALQGALGRLGMQIADQSADIGYLNVRAPAPRPLTPQEWKVAAESDLPRMRELAERHVGLMARFAKFEPDGLDIVINATTLEVRDGTEVSLTMRMREVTPPKSGRPRRDYAPPTAVSMGLDKIWLEVDRDLKDATWRR
jgi:hypothetical protein